MASRPIAGIVGALTPVGVVAVEATADRGSTGVPAAPRRAEETHLLGPDVSPNRAQSIEVRDCARTALIQLGERPVPIARAPTGEPEWPAGIVGSMTHTAGFRAAIVARRGDFAGLGIDAEVCRVVSAGLTKTYTGPAERAHLAQLPAHLPAALALFCAKEAAFKAWFPRTRIWLGMKDAEARIGVDGVFTVVPRPRNADQELSPGREWPEIHGRWLARCGLLVAVAWIPSDFPVS